jgi:hypothetical protein
MKIDLIKDDTVNKRNSVSFFFYYNVVCAEATRLVGFLSLMPA